MMGRQERMSRDGKNIGNQGEEDNINTADSRDDEPALDCHVVIENNTSTPKNSGTTSSNQLLATLPRGNGLPTTEEMMAAWNLVQQQQEQEHALHNDNNKGDNKCRKESTVLQSSKATPEKACQHLHTRLGENSSYLQEM